MEEEEVIKVKLRFVIFRNESNQYTVAKFYDLDTRDDLVCTGVFPFDDITQEYRLTGVYSEHPKYGFQFQIHQAEILLPDEKDSLIDFFSSSRFPGIGKKTAKQIVECLQEDVIQQIVKHPEVLNTIPSLNEKRKESLIQGLKEYQGTDEFQIFCERHGLTQSQKEKIEHVYGKQSLIKLQENPYSIVEDVQGIGFQTAEKLANSLSFEKEHIYRYRAVVIVFLQNYGMRTGNTYIEEEVLIEKIEKKLPSVNIEEILEELQSDGKIIKENGNIYLDAMMESELGIARFLGNFPYVEHHDEVNELETAIGQIEKEFAISYDQLQKDAIYLFFSNPFSILTGGPGTGKTTIIRGIIRLYQQLYPNSVIACCAPTGRAAKRLNELCEIPTCTIHSLLKWDLERGMFLMDEKDPITADLLIVDEFSMVDQWVFYSLLKASKRVSKILLIGDEDQLPSVGSGCVLHDLLESQCFPSVRLTKIYRQSSDSEVVTLAHEMKKGNITSLEHGKDLAFFSCESHEVCTYVLQIVKNALEKGYDEKDIQVLAPMYAGAAGIDLLNKTLQQALNPASEKQKELRIGFQTFREGDKVLQLKNQPDDQVFNGDIGFIEEIVLASEDVNHIPTIYVSFDDTIVEYRGEQIYNITLAYCISVHKAQGSEYPIVILPIVKEYRVMLQKRLLYTAITRARKSLVLLGDQTVLQKAVQKEEQQIRKSTLAQRIRYFME